jgi:hypothetical protein
MNKDYERNYFFEAHELLKLQGYRFYVQKLLPKGKWRGHEWVALNPTRNDKNLGSFSVNCLNGRWKDFAVNKGGSDLIGLTAYIKGITLTEACFYIGVARPKSKALGGQNA